MTVTSRKEHEAEYDDSEESSSQGNPRHGAPIGQREVGKPCGGVDVLRRQKLVPEVLLSSETSD